jgi:phage tail sheath protein FI
MASMAGKAPGVYVQEVPAADKPIAGVGTSTAGFIGVFSESITGEAIGTADGTNKEFMLRSYPVVTDAGSFAIKVGDAAQSSGVTLTNDDTRKRAKVVFAQAPTAGAITADYKIALSADPTVAAKPGEVKLCTNFTEFTKYFGDFSSLAGQSMLAHAVYGFFNNGGTRCFVVRDISTATIDALLTKFAAIDEIAIVAAPGIAEKSVRTSIYNHCQNLEDRFAIFDTGKDDLLTDIVKTSSTIAPDRTTYAALYFPWLLEFDPLAKAANPAGDGSIPVPPSGHIAGIFARVDTNRGVHKAPANEVVLGAMGLYAAVSKIDQGGVNDQGVNCIRSLNGNILVWGARTLAGPNDPDLKYINVRRLLIFLRESIEQGTQWVVFEPNSPALWQKIKRNITAFLTNVWRDGALFGDTAQQAFYVKCDAETNPPELRDIGQVVTEIGVAIVRPAEFVIFRISQWSGPPA